MALHGFEDDPERLAAPLRHLIADAGLADRWQVIAPRGPAETPAGPSWFGADGIADPDAVAAAVAAVHEVAAAPDADGAAPEGPLVLVGFSQGGALALAVAHGPVGPATDALTGVCCCGGFLLSPDDATYDWEGEPTPTLLVHGADDDVVDPQQARAGARALERRGIPVEHCEVATGHQVDATLLAPVVAWLAGR